MLMPIEIAGLLLMAVGAAGLVAVARRART